MSQRSRFALIRAAVAAAAAGAAMALGPEILANGVWGN